MSGNDVRVLDKPGIIFPDISLRDEGFEISTPFTLPLFQRTGVAFLPARQVPGVPANTL